MKLIDKDALRTEIERRISTYKRHYEELVRYEVWNDAKKIEPKINELENLLSFINTIEVKEVETWHLQEKEDIYDAVKDWGLYKFVCIMKDGTIQRFNGCLDEDCEGHINVHINGINDDYDDVDDIVKWIEIT